MDVSWGSNQVSGIDPINPPLPSEEMFLSFGPASVSWINKMWGGSSCRCVEGAAGDAQHIVMTNLWKQEISVWEKYNMLRLPVQICSFSSVYLPLRLNKAPIRSPSHVQSSEICWTSCSLELVVMYLYLHIQCIWAPCVENTDTLCSEADKLSEKPLAQRKWAPRDAALLMMPCCIQCRRASRGLVHRFRWYLLYGQSVSGKTTHTHHTEAFKGQLSIADCPCFQLSRDAGKTSLPNVEYNNISQYKGRNLNFIKSILGR